MRGKFISRLHDFFSLKRFLVSIIYGVSIFMTPGCVFTADNTAEMVRMPYLQLVTPNSAVIRWRTASPEIGVVRYGTSNNNPDKSVSEGSAKTEHEVRITGLSYGTKYYYTVGNNTGSHAGGKDFYVFPAPPAGTVSPLRVWVVSDFGQGSSETWNRTVNSYLSFTGDTHTDVVLGTGDQVDEPYDSSYTCEFFNPLNPVLRNSPGYFAEGNHDNHDLEGGTDNMYKHFTLPENAELGGFPSGTEKWYSFDVGNVHFICINNYEDESAAGPQGEWLKKDLAATKQLWRVLFHHKSEYTAGHHYEIPDGSVNDLTKLLEDGGVDLVLTGHNHVYERSFLIDGIYSNIWNPETQKYIDTKKGVCGESYRKENGPHNGTIYLNNTGAGYSGKFEVSLLPFMTTAFERTPGSVILDFNDDSLKATFLRSDGLTGETWCIIKSGANIPVGPTEMK